MPDNTKLEYESTAFIDGSKKVKFEVYGEEIVNKTVMGTGNLGRIYLPPAWINHHVKIIRID